MADELPIHGESNQAANYSIQFSKQLTLKSAMKYPAGTMQALKPTQSVRPITLPGLSPLYILIACIYTPQQFPKPLTLKPASRWLVLEDRENPMHA